MRAALIIIFIILAACSPDPELAKTLCLSGKDKAPLDDQIKACTFIIEQGTADKAELAQFHLHRGRYLFELHFDKHDAWRYRSHKYERFNINIQQENSTAPRGREDYYEFGIKDAEIALNLAPNNTYTNEFMGYTWFVYGRYIKAIPFYEKALEKRPRDHLIHYHLGASYLENAYMGDEKFERALFHFNQTLELNPNYFKVYARLGDTFYERAQPPEWKQLTPLERGDAIPDLERAVGNYKTFLERSKPKIPIIESHKYRTAQSELTAIRKAKAQLKTKAPEQ